MAISRREVGIIAAVELAAGAMESIVIPNLGKKAGEKFILPPKTNLAISVACLGITGIMAGVVADHILTQMKIDETQRKKRVLVIAGTAFVFNIIEAVLAENILHHKVEISKWQLPTARKFSSNLSLLALTGLAVGLFSDQLIAATAPPLTANKVLVDKVGQIAETIK